MKSFANWDRKIMFLSLAVMFGFASWGIWTTTRTIEKVGQQLTASLSQSANGITTTLAGVNGTVQKMDQTLDTVNRPCGGGHPCGTLADFTKTLNTARMTLGQIEVAANHEDKNLTNLDEQEATLFKDTHETLSNAATLLATTNSGVQGEFVNLEKTTTDIDNFMSNPDLYQTVHNLNVTTDNLGKTTTDFQTKFHDFLYPPPCHGWKCHLVLLYKGAKIAGTFTEPSYWAYELIKSSTP